MTEAELLRAIEDATKRQLSGDGMTVTEIAKATGASPNRVRRVVRDGLDQGLLVRTQKYVETIGGKMTPVSSFRVREQPKRVKATRRRA